MYYLKLVFKNIFRHKLRSLLTLLGLVVAILAFGLLQSVVNAWYAGSDMASAKRLVARNAISLVFPLPIYYRERIRAVDGVTAVGTSNWFGGHLPGHDRRPTSSPSSRWTTRTSSTSTRSSGRGPRSSSPARRTAAAPWWAVFSPTSTAGASAT